VIRPGLRTFQETTEILFERLRVLPAALPVDTDCPVLPSPTVRFEEQVEVHVMRKRGECPLRHRLRQLRYPLEFR
jgi:hypothetical protein